MKRKSTRIQYWYVGETGVVDIGHFVVNGSPADLPLATIRSCLADGGKFLPEQVGIPPLGPSVRNGELSHELPGVFAQGSDEPSTNGRSLGDLVERFLEIGPYGWEVEEASTNGNGPIPTGAHDARTLTLAFE